MIPMARPLIGQSEIDAVVEVLRSGQLAQGRVVEEFEHRFAGILGCEHAVATTSGTTALHVALLSHGIGPGDEVITTSFSFIASANSILYTGATPVFADIDMDTLTIDPDDVERKITPRTRAIMPVHLYGNPANLDRLTEIAEAYGLELIEDACQAHGATLHGRAVGTFGTGVFSFYPTKNVMSGEGGMIATNDGHIAEQARLIRAHGMPRRYVHEILGFNFRLSNIHAAIGLVQLDSLAEWTRQRRANAARLEAGLQGCGVAFQRVLPGAEHVYHQFTIRIPDGRDQLAVELREQGIGSEVYYPIPIHEQKVYRDRGYDDVLPNTERAAREVLSLPVHPSVTDAEISHVISGVGRALAHAREPISASD